MDWRLWTNNELDECARLERDWDSYGAEPIAAAAIREAHLFLRLVYARTRHLPDERSEPQIVAPRPDGGMQIEWDAAPLELNVHTSAEGEFGYLLIDKRTGDVTYTEHFPVTHEEVLEQLLLVLIYHEQEKHV